MSYIIVQDARKTLGTIALIDRNTTTEQGKWWTSILKYAKVFETKAEADEVCSKYKYNNPRVVPFDKAEEIIKPIITTSYSLVNKNRKLNIFEMNDYEYKEWLGYSDAIEQGGGMFN